MREEKTRESDRKNQKEEHSVNAMKTDSERLGSDPDILLRQNKIRINWTQEDREFNGIGTQRYLWGLR